MWLWPDFWQWLAQVMEPTDKEDDLLGTLETSEDGLVFLAILFEWEVLIEVCNPARADMAFGLEATSRLACQIILTKELVRISAIYPQRNEMKNDEKTTRRLAEEMQREIEWEDACGFPFILTGSLVENGEQEGLEMHLPQATRNFYVDGHVPTPH
jgi:hypothetical protein